MDELGKNGDYVDTLEVDVGKIEIEEAASVEEITDVHVVDVTDVVDDDWTIMKVTLADRQPITLETVKTLLRDEDLRDVADVALKYKK